MDPFIDTGNSEIIRRGGNGERFKRLQVLDTRAIQMIAVRIAQTLRNEAILRNIKIAEHHPQIVAMDIATAHLQIGLNLDRLLTLSSLDLLTFYTELAKRVVREKCEVVDEGGLIFWKK